MYSSSPSQGFGFGRSQSPFDDDFFSLGAPVGPGQPNRREDVIKVETILGNTGHHDLAKTDGPLGWWSDRQEKAVKDWQGENGLKVDGLLKPNGPTITSLKQAAGGLLGGFKPPSPDEVDEHHGLRAQGEPGLLNTRPARLSIRVPEKVPELDEQSLAFNTDTARALTRTSVDGDVPNIYANYLKQAGSEGHTTVLDLVEQVNTTQGRDRAERVLHGILGQLPPDQAKAFLGGEVPAQRPIGVRMADLADDDAVPLFARAAEQIPSTQEGSGNVLSAPIPPTVTPGPVPPPNPGETDIHIPADPKPEPEKKPETTTPAPPPEPTAQPASQEGGERPSNTPPPPATGEDTPDRTPAQRDAEVLKDPANVPGYTQWLAEGAKKDPQWAEQHARDVSREVYKTNPQAAEEMVRQGEKAGVKVNLYADGHQASKSAKVLKEEAKGGYLSSGPDKGSEECVALVKHATPELQGITADRWKEGEKIKGPGDPPLKPGTALATFENGKYQNKPNGNHAVVFDRYGEENGKKGMYVLEQARNVPAREKFIPFDDRNGKPIYQAEKYSVIRKP